MQKEKKRKEREMSRLFTLLSLVSCTIVAARGDLIIKTVDEYIAFAKEVNNNTRSYQEETVFLSNDLDFTGVSVPPIGNTEEGVFRGTFDGQGHHLSNLVISTQEEYVGLFGLSTYGITVINLVLDSTCAFEGVQSAQGQRSSEVHIGGIIGACISSLNDCSVRNSVVMGRATFSGQSSGPELSIGGVIGDCFASEGRCTISNAANFGSVVFSGTHAGESAAIGGVVGECDGTTSSVSACYVLNSANFGAVLYSGAAHGSVHMGGVIGVGAFYVYLTNCVGDGPVVVSPAGPLGGNESSARAGGVAGSLTERSIIYASYSGPRNAGIPITGELDATTKNNITRRYDAALALERPAYVPQYEGTCLVRALNAIVSDQAERRLAQWVGNPLGATLTFVADADVARPLAVRSERLVLFPTPAASAGREFDGWYEEIDLETPFIRSNVTANTTLYGLWVSDRVVTITFAANGGEEVGPVRARYGTYTPLPFPEREGYVIAKWVDNRTGLPVPFHYRVPAHNVTLKAVWAISNIFTADNFREFVSVVNNGYFSYSDSIVSLEADIDLSNKTWDISPVGTAHYPFRGTFEGNGHVIYNLSLSSRLRHTGLFGYCERGTDIRNLVLDASCTVESTYSQTGDHDDEEEGEGEGDNYKYDHVGNDEDEAKKNAYLGSVIGYCTEDNGCNMFNVISFAKLSYTGSAFGVKLYVGGIAGACTIKTLHGCNATNCIHKGDIAITGSVSELVLGGIIGSCSHDNNIDDYGGDDDDDDDEGDINGKCFISKCLSDADMTVDPEAVSDRIVIGGIAGAVYNGVVKLCASESEFNIGNLSANATVVRGNVLGTIATTTAQRVHGPCATDRNSTGEMLSSVSTLNCECFDEKFVLNEGTVVDDLNKYSKAKAMWLLNAQHHKVTLVVNGTTLFEDTSGVVLLPGFESTSRGLGFSGWFSDPRLSVPFETSTIEEDVSVYGHWKYLGPRDDENITLYIIIFVLGIVAFVALISVVVVLIICKVTGCHKRNESKEDELRRALVNDELIFN